MSADERAGKGAMREGPMDAEEAWKAYQICAVRGHEPSGLTLTSSPPWSVCRHCGTHYRYETRTIEANVPHDPFEDGGT